MCVFVLTNVPEMQNSSILEREKSIDVFQKEDMFNLTKIPNTILIKFNMQH